MALLDDIEPPSHKVKKENNLINKNPHVQSFFKKRADIFRAVSSLSFMTSINDKLGGSLKAAAKSVGNFFVANKYLPHVVLIILGTFVTASNINEKVFASNIYSSFIVTGPETEYSVSSSVDFFTPLIENDSESVQKSIIASTASDGFTSTQGTVATEVTSREDPLPDNSANTVKYTVRDGDTLTGLGWKFEVKLSTLKYVNDLSDVDLIKPGMTLKIPQRGYEVSATQIAKKEAEKKAKLAAASRNTVTRNSSSSRSTASSANTGNYGTINGVKYVRRAKSNELQCYTYVTSLGYPVGGHYLAKWIPTNSNTPRVGGLVVTYESWAGHVAVVTGVNSDGTFNIRESNYTAGWITERTMSVHNGNIKGYVN